ncbi:hypothetical protein LguiA_003221 [Lonicera macranthoides]
MDSPNSGSIQSSSGGDEDYDSRADSISNYMNPLTHAPPSAAARGFLHHPTTTPMFDPLSNFFDPIPRPSQNPTSTLLNLDPVWSKTPRSGPNSGDLNPIHPTTSSFHPFFTTPQFTTSSPAPQFPSVPENPNPRATLPDHTRVGVRNPKKRSRASRRAPTTVLTTDTTNFRAMVQEFTGIPAPPFTSSPFPRGRFDLFGGPSSMRSNPLDSPYLLKPFAQKAQQLSPFSSSSSLLNAIASSSTNNDTNNTTTATPTPLNTNSCHVSDFTLPKPPPTLGMLNSFLHFDPTSQIEPTQTHLKMGGLDEFGLTHGLPSLVSGDGGSGGGDHGGGHLGVINGNYNYSSSSKTTSVKVNYLGSSSTNFQGGNNKGAENASSRGEGMVESWICSSD